MSEIVIIQELDCDEILVKTTIPGITDTSY
jgi:hypothetical protein